MANKNLVIFCTHFINKTIINEFKKFMNIPNFDCVLVINNESLKSEPEYSMPYDNASIQKYVVNKEFYGLNIPCLLFDETLSKNIGLPNNYKNTKGTSFGWTMWYNGDYRLYYAKKFFPDYDYYWQIEYDVFMNGSYEIFFDKYKNDTTDLIIPMFRKETPHSGWGWNDNIEWLYGKDAQIYASFFPVLRISNKALDFLYKRRLEIAEIFNNMEMTEETHWIFCETFVPTELMLNGFSCANLDEPNVMLPMTEFDLSTDRIFEKPDNMLYHPVKGDFINRIKHLNKIINELKSRLPVEQR